jgi:predicted transcriptional regulator
MEQTIIMVEHGKANEIARALNVSKAMVSMSLKGKVNSKKAQKIRYVALKEYEGVEMKAVEPKKQPRDNPISKNSEQMRSN